MIAVRPLDYDSLWAVRAVSREAAFDMWRPDQARAYLRAVCSDRMLVRRLECSVTALAWGGGEPLALVEAMRRGAGYELATLQVRSAYRRQGIGSALVAWEGLPADLTARVERHNTIAAAFLRARGFRPAGEEWSPFGGDAVDRYQRRAEAASALPGRGRRR